MKIEINTQTATNEELHDALLLILNSIKFRARKYMPARIQEQEKIKDHLDWYRLKYIVPDSTNKVPVRELHRHYLSIGGSMPFNTFTRNIGMKATTIRIGSLVTRGYKGIKIKE